MVNTKGSKARRISKGKKAIGTAVADESVKQCEPEEDEPEESSEEEDIVPDNEASVAERVEEQADEADKEGIAEDEAFAEGEDGQETKEEGREAAECAEEQEARVEQTLKWRGKRKRNKQKRVHSSIAPESRRGEATREFQLAGVIFLCNAVTKEDCFRHHVFGFPEAKKAIIEKVKKGMKLFLFDTDQKILHGIYRASSAGGMNLVPRAFQGFERKFPAQVRFRIYKDCAPLQESEFKHVIRENIFRGSKFKSELTSEQVGNLIRLFRSLPRPQRAHVSRDVPWSQRERNAGRERFSFAAPGALPPGRCMSSNGPEHGASSLRFAPAPPRESAYPRQYAPLHGREYPSYTSASRVALAEAEALYQQMLQEVRADEARRIYLQNLTGIEAAPRRYLNDLDLNQTGQIANRPLSHEYPEYPLYRNAEYQRQAPNYGGFRRPDFRY